MKCAGYTEKLVFSPSLPEVHLQNIQKLASVLLLSNTDGLLMLKSAPVTRVHYPGHWLVSREIAREREKECIELERNVEDGERGRESVCVKEMGERVCVCVRERGGGRERESV